MPQQKKLLWPTLSALAGILILCFLGYWQLQRLEWKTAMIDALDAEYAKDAAQLVLSPSEIEGNYNFKRGTLRGAYDFDKQITVGPRVYKNLPGRHVITPFKLEDGTTILVNRGWVPNEWRSDTELPEARAAAQTGSVTGLLRNAQKPNPFTPDNDLLKGEWYYANPAQIAEVKSIKRMHDKIIYLEGSETESNYPIAQATKPILPNDHLQYAIFWFTMAGVLFVIYCLRFLKKDKPRA
jgi:surfeit locus 1 family protein